LIIPNYSPCSLNLFHILVLTNQVILMRKIVILYLLFFNFAQSQTSINSLKVALDKTTEVKKKASLLILITVEVSSNSIKRI